MKILVVTFSLIWFSLPCIAQDMDSLAQYNENEQDSITAKLFHADSLLHFAGKFVGAPYLMAGSSPSGFDCSGFTLYCFQQFGIHLPHSAHDQVNLGEEVHISEAQPGDLLFFKGHDINDHGIHHVAIMVGKADGHIRFIHSASHSVHYDNLNSSYYGPRFVKIKRIH